LVLLQEYITMHVTLNVKFRFNKLDSVHKGETSGAFALLFLPNF